MDRREKMLNNLNLSRLSGVEIGALAWPLVRKTEGDITYVDFADAETLRRNHAESGNVPLDQIVEVDAIWGANTLQQAIGADRKVDYVIASHVIEHVPDLVTWLEELVSILKAGGEIRLAIPDRRFTFDYLRNETTLADVVAAHMLRARVPQPHAVLDFMINWVDVDRVVAWSGAVDRRNLKRHCTLEKSIEVAALALKGEYRDVHCWVFTPQSLAVLFSSLAREGFLSLECTQFYDTAQDQYEFFVAVRPCVSAERAALSWDLVASQARLDVPGSSDAREKELANTLSEISRESVDLRSSVSALSARLDDKALEAERLREQLSAIQARATALEQSTSWRVTAPLRALSTAISQRRKSHKIA